MSRPKRYFNDYPPSPPPSPCRTTKGHSCLNPNAEPFVPDKDLRDHILELCATSDKKCVLALAVADWDNRDPTLAKWGKEEILRLDRRCRHLGDMISIRSCKIAKRYYNLPARANSDDQPSRTPITRLSRSDSNGLVWTNSFVRK